MNAGLEERATVNIINCLKDPNLMGGLLKDPQTWKAWFVLLKAFFGLPMTTRSIFRYLVRQVQKILLSGKKLFFFFIHSFYFGLYQTNLNL